MKFKCKEAWQEDFDKLQEWHEWFAWYPVKIEKNTCVWLEKIQRKGTYMYWGVLDANWFWQYKAKENK